MIYKSLVVLVVLFLSSVSFGTDYYIHPSLGNDKNNGLSKTSAFESLERIGAIELKAGDHVYLANGVEYKGMLHLQSIKGEKDNHVIIESINWSANSINEFALINAQNFPAAVKLEGSSGVTVRNLRVVADGYLQAKAGETMRVGVLVLPGKQNVTEHIHIENIHVRSVYFENKGYERGKEEVFTSNGKERYGWGIRVINNEDENQLIRKVVIKDCFIEHVGHTGIKLTGKNRNIQEVEIINNRVNHSGGPGIQMSNTSFVYVGNNNVTYSGSTTDSRKWGRGSGFWTWGSSTILIENNKFMYANGPGDSAGAHIDYNCEHVVLQYNLSAHNAGGFCEILGNNYNCAYRYNISINDGHRVKGEGKAFQEGKTFWLSGYVGDKARKGPINTYFYNNTIYVSDSITSKVAIENNSNGILIQNNLFYIEGAGEYVLGDQYKPDDGTGEVRLKNVVFKNNFFLRNDNWPKEALIKDSNPVTEQPKLVNPGGLDATDYLPQNKAYEKLGLQITTIPEDRFGLVTGLRPTKDFLGEKIKAGKTPVGALLPK